MYIQRLLPFPLNQCLPADRISRVCSSLITVLHMQQTLGSAHSDPGFCRQTGPLVHLTRWLGNNYKVARGGRLLCIGIVLMVLPPSSVFHTSSCRIKKYFTPLELAERDVHTKVDGVYLWLVTSDRWTWDKCTSSSTEGLRRIISWDLRMDIYLKLRMFYFSIKS